MQYLIKYVSISKDDSEVVTYECANQAVINQLNNLKNLENFLGFYFCFGIISIEEITESELQIIKKYLPECEENHGLISRAERLYKKPFQDRKSKAALIDLLDKLK